MQVDGLVLFFDNVDSIHNNLNQLIGEVRWKFSPETRSGNADQQRFVNGGLDLELIEKFQALFLRQFVSLGDNSGMNLLLDEPLGLFHELPNQKNIGCASISNNIILRGSRPGDHGRSGVLDLHLV